MKTKKVTTHTYEFNLEEVAEILREHLKVKGKATAEEIMGGSDEDWRGEMPLELKGLVLTVTE